MTSRDPRMCCEAVRSAILATAWLLVFQVNIGLRPEYSVTVRLECRRTPGILGEEIRPHHAVTPRTALVEGPGDDPFSARRAGSIPAQHCTDIPHRVTTTGP